MNKLTPDHLRLNGFHRIMHVAVFLLGYASASVFGVFILCSSLDSSFSEQLYPFFLRFLGLYIDWSAGFCLIFALVYLAVEFIRTRFFSHSYQAENAWIVGKLKKIRAGQGR